MHRPLPARLPFLIALLGATALWVAAPGASVASCVPLQLRPLADEPDTVVVAGTVAQTDPQRVAIDVRLWWGADPQPSVAIVRPATDPTVISSTDWNPKPGEQWIVLARREGGSLRTAVCDQMPATVMSVGEIESSLGPGIVPSEPKPTGSPTGESALPGWIPLVGAGVLVALLAASLLALDRRRRAAGSH